MPSEFESEAARVREAIASLPRVFGLRGFPGRRLEICEASSMFCGADLVYVALVGGGPLCKGTLAELRRAMTEAPIV